MKITYIEHSAFLIETQHQLFLFDYAQGKLPALHPHKPLYVFISHAHGDHYSSGIYHIEHPAITYVLSADITTSYPHIAVKPHEQYRFDGLEVNTLSSTDEGVAFDIWCEEGRIYHAGDLNWWDWGEEDSLQESIAMKEAYLREMERIAQRHYRVAFVPVDPRLRMRCLQGLHTFLQYAQSDVVIPMHFWENTAIFSLLKKDATLHSQKLWTNFQKLETFTI